MDPQGHGTAGTTNSGAFSFYFNLRDHVIASFNFNSPLDTLRADVFFFFFFKSSQANTNLKYMSKLSSLVI